jgi:hypothetical protein
MLFADKRAIKRYLQHFQQLLMNHTEHERRLDDFGPDTALSCQRPEACPVIRGNKFSVFQTNFIRIL